MINRHVEHVRMAAVWQNKGRWNNQLAKQEMDSIGYSHSLNIFILSSNETKRC